MSEYTGGPPDELADMTDNPMQYMIAINADKFATFLECVLKAIEETTEKQNEKED